MALDPTMKRLFREADANLDGRLGVSVEWLQTGERWGLNETEMFPTASTIKIPVLMALFEKAKAGDLDLESEYELKKSDVTGGSGILKNLTPGLSLTYRDYAMLMTVLSDNTATNICIDAVGLKEINELMHAWGYGATFLHRKVKFEKAPDDPPQLGDSSPADMTAMLASIARREFLGKPWDEEMERILSEQKYDTALPRYLPEAGLTDEDVTLDIVVAHKTGSVRGVRVDAGIVTAPFGRYVISAFTKDMTDMRYHSDNAGILAIGALSRKVYDVLETEYG